MSAPTTLPPTWILAILVAVFTALWFANLETRRLVHPDEGRYAEIAREMAQSGDWVTPRISAIKYFEKPPLQYWITAVAFRAFGVREGAARLWPALAGFIAVVALAGTGCALGGAPLGAYAGLALAGMLWHAGLAQIVTLDSGLSCFLALAFAGFVIAQRAESSAGQRRTWMWAAWAALALGTLSKGPVAVVLAGGALVGYTAITRDYALWRRLHPVSGAVIYLALTAPWFVAVARANEEFLHFFFIQEHLQRFLTTEHRREGPWHYFIPLALAGSLPWLAVLARGARTAWRDGVPNALGFSWQRFALVWAAFVFLFFSASGSKLPSYILPMFPPLALVAAWLMLKLEPLTLFRLTWPAAMAVAVLAVAAFVGYDEAVLRRYAGQPRPESVLAFGSWVKAALAIAALGTASAALAFARGARFWGVVALSVSTLGALQLATAGFDALSAVRSTSAILRTAQASAPFAAEAPIYQVQMYDHTAPFYLGRATMPVAFRDELGPGIDAEPDRQIPTMAVWRATWQGLVQGYALLPPVLYADLVADGVPMRLLAQDAYRVVVSRR
jgi:4-amino-4-deoxy-L-arabinose transferase-like glycosyltransferase